MPIDLIRKIRAVRRRLQWIEFCRLFLLALGACSLALFGFVLVTRLYPLDTELRDVITGAGVFGAVAPLGGLSLMAGWALLALGAIRRR